MDEIGIGNIVKMMIMVLTIMYEYTVRAKEPSFPSVSATPFSTSLFHSPFFDNDSAFSKIMKNHKFNICIAFTWVGCIELRLPLLLIGMSFCYFSVLIVPPTPLITPRLYMVTYLYISFIYKSSKVKKASNTLYL